MEEEGGVTAPVTRLRRRQSVEQLESPSAPATPTKKRGTRLAAKPQLDLIDEHAPVTRLRRRQSVEQLESPSAPATPTKKRGTRLAAKPQLDLIDEHAITNSPSSTKKTTSRNLAEQDKKSTTPARRSTRVQSNTSLVSEVEDKQSTPARRNTRTKSNTSIVAETTQNEGTPRAKRASARRNSQVGSDTELSLTPLKGKRTRKTSTSSVDKEGTTTASEAAIIPDKDKTSKGSSSSVDNTPAEENPTDKPKSLITEVIAEEPEDKLENSTSGNHDSKKESPIARKSPRLAMKGRKSYAGGLCQKLCTCENVSQYEPCQNKVQTAENPSQDPNTVTETKHTISLATSTSITTDFDAEVKRTFDKSKSLSDVEDYKSNRNRTKSWTTLTSPVPEKSFHSDNESSKKKHENQFLGKSWSLTGSGDGPQIATTKEKEGTDLETSLSIKSMKNRRSKENSFINDMALNIAQYKTETLRKSEISNESNKENILGVVPPTKNASAVDFMLEKDPNDVKSTILFEDSEIIIKSTHHNNFEHDDQLVPVAKLTVSPKNVEQNVFKLNTETGNDDSVEPMDIDETVPENVSLTVFEEGNNSRKSSLCLAQEPVKETCNNSKRKSSFSITEMLEKKSCDTQNKDKKSRKSSLNILQDSDGTKDISSKLNRKSLGSLTLSQDSDSGTDTPKSKRKSASQSVTQDELINEEFKPNKGKDKSEKSYMSVSKEPDSSNYNQTPNTSGTQDLEKIQNENKSTLVLSQIKDVSAAEGNESKSLQDKENISQSATSGPVNKKLALDYLTSTPVQQKNNENLTMQMNTSVITPTTKTKNGEDTNKTSLNEVIGYKKKKSKRLSESVCNESNKNVSKKHFSATVSSINDTSDDEGDSSHNQSTLLDDEAEDAGDDYESGDSQDEDERKYERENEILDKGETLTSEDEHSVDSDYEKDSFVVSSDEEDDELLSGSGDDLNMSDNELGMSAKSKKKYNDKKLMEQKKASKEMYDARHGLNKSDKSKKSSRNHIDSMLLKSDDEYQAPKKNRRMRLDSSTLENSGAKSDTKEMSKKNISNVSGQEEVSCKKKTSKRLLESVCNVNELNEKEITIYSSEGSKQDPLSVNIKLEPKTPQKDLEISIFQINENIEEIHVDQNATMLKPTDTVDPLQASLAAEDNHIDDDDGSISENEEITSNYDSVLKQLNQQWHTLIKTHDNSLDLKKKSKKTKVPIFDELNLTETKSFKAFKDNSKDSKEKSVNRVFKKLADGQDESGDSIELNLFFDDESNGSEKPENLVNKEDNAERIIPLKSTEAKTNIHCGIGSDKNGEVIGDISLSTRVKQQNGKGAATESEGMESEEDVDAFNFFIDTKGDLGDEQTNDTQDSDSNEAPLEVFYVNNKNKKIKKSSEPFQETPAEPKTPDIGKKMKEILSESLKPYKPESQTETVKSPKSKKKKKVPESEEAETSEVLTLKSKTPTNEKKNKKNSESHNEDLQIEATDKSIIVTSDKKNKKKIQSQNEELQTEMSKVVVTEKKKKKYSESQYEDLQINEAMSDSISSEKKKKKKAKSEEADTSEVLTLKSKTPVNERKKKKNFESQNEDLQIEVADKSMPVTSEKKKKKKLDLKSEVQIEVPDTSKSLTSDKKKKQNEDPQIEDVNVFKQVASEKKKKKRFESQNECLHVEPAPMSNPVTSDKKKKKTSQLLKTTEDPVCSTEVAGAQKRKRNTSTNESFLDIDLNTSNEPVISKKKKFKISNNTIEGIVPEADSKVARKVKKNKNEETESENQPRKKRKRREYEDDNEAEVPKIFKAQSSDTVTRLPSTILAQLDDKPKQQRKMAKTVSPFETTLKETYKKKNKPSTFLEDSVYLDESLEIIPKKGTLTKPKVLPSLPTAPLPSTSGFTTNLKVEVMEFVAKSSEVQNFKNDYLRNKRMKKLRTYDHYNKRRNMKLNKY